MAQNNLKSTFYLQNKCDFIPLGLLSILRYGIRFLMRIKIAMSEFQLSRYISAQCLNVEKHFLTFKSLSMSH